MTAVPVITRAPDRSQQIVIELAPANAEATVLLVVGIGAARAVDQADAKAR